MRAALLKTIPGQLEIEEVVIGEPGPGEVLVQTRPRPVFAIATCTS